MPVSDPPSKTPTGYAQAVHQAEDPGLEINADDPRWQLTQRIVANGSMGRSRRLAEFLLYVVERHLSNRSIDISEQQIGVQVFGRREDYDPAEDNIVRSYARTLRERIQKYFETEGKEEELLLEIPRGGYEPIFVSRRSQLDVVCEEICESASLMTNSAIAEDVPENVTETVGRDTLGRMTIGTLHLLKGVVELFKRNPLLTLGLGAFFGIWFSLAIVRESSPFSPEQAATRVLWSELFSKDHDTFVVPSDNGLVIMQGLIPSPVPLDSYIDGSYRTKAWTDGSLGVKRLLILGSKRYTSVTDLEIVAHLTQLNDIAPQRMMIRYAHDLRMDDLRSGNAILLGATQSNPWVQLFQPQMHFRFRLDKDLDKELVITNEHPRPGEAHVFTHTGDEHTYGVIAYVPNLSSTGHVLIVAGVNMAGTQAAETVLMNPDLIGPTLKRAQTLHGDLQPFELLIESDNVATNSSIPHIVLERIGPVPQN